MRGICNKRGQFFLLAAIIISAIVLSFGTITNYAIISPEPRSLSDFSYDVKRETGKVVDYEVYNKFNMGANLDSFVDLFAEDIRDRGLDANFLFIYGDETNLTFKNYGASDVSVGNSQIPGGGSKIESKINYGGVSQKVEFQYDGKSSRWVKSIAPSAGASGVSITIGDYDYVFPVSSDRQVIFIMQKEAQNESFITVR